MPGPGGEETRRVALCLLESRIDVVVTGAAADALAQAITTAWAWCLADPTADQPTAPGTLEVVVDARPEVLAAAHQRGALVARDVATAMHTLSSALTQRAIEARMGQWWLLHACAVADPRTGATVVLVGPSGMGKTTAAAALGRQFAYLSDETAAIRPDGGVVPYPKPLSVLEPGSPIKQQRGPAELGLVRGGARPWLAAIALLERTDTPRPSVEPVRTVEALPALAAQTSALHLLERPLHLMAGHLARTGGLRRLSYTNAEDLAPMVGALLGGAQ